MAEIFNIIYVVVGVILLFGAAIFVHEWGHYYVALKRGLKVEAFAIGFGPPIYVWKKNGIEYSIRWIPAGGYVKLPQMLTSEALEGENQGEPTEPLPPASPFSKILVAFAGPVMNVVFAFAIATLIYFVGLPVKVNPSIIGYVDPKSDEAKQGVQTGGRITKVDGQVAKSWEDVFQKVIIARTNVIPVEIEQDGTAQTYHLKAIIQEEIGLKVLNLEPRDRPVIKEVMAEGAAAKGGMKAEDEVISIGGIPVVGRQQFINEIEKRPGKETEIIVKRGGDNISLSVTPQGDPKGKIGVYVGGSSTETYVVQKPGPLPWVLMGEVFDQIRTTISALAHSKETGVGAKDLSGPVGILAFLGSQVNADYRLALKFMILLNISLAIMNLLPIPVLDGGHIAMSIMERLRGKPLNIRVQEYTTTAFALMLISFMLYVTFYDVMRMKFFKSMFTQDVQIESQEKRATPPLEPAPESP